jgi:SecD/SecF fusion protein
MGNFLMAANDNKEKKLKLRRNKPVVKDSLSALLTNGGDSAATKKGNNPCLTKLLHKAVDLF